MRQRTLSRIVITTAACGLLLGGCADTTNNPNSTNPSETTQSQSSAWDDNATPSYYSKTYSRVTDGEVALADKPFSETEPYKVIAILNNQALVVQGKNDDAPHVVYIIDSYTEGVGNDFPQEYDIDPTKISSLDNSERSDPVTQEGTRSLIAQFLEDRGGIVYLEKDDSVPYEAITNGLNDNLSDKQKEMVKSAGLSWNAHVWGTAPDKRDNLEQELLTGYLAKNGAHECLNDEVMNFYNHVRAEAEKANVIDLPCRHAPNTVGEDYGERTYYPSKYYTEIDRLAAQGRDDRNERMGFTTPNTEGE